MSYAEPRVNIRSRFDFDDTKPVAGIVQDEEREKAIAAAWHMVLHNLAAIVISLAGFWLISWWIHGGFLWASWFMWKYCHDLMAMVVYGVV